MDPDCSSAAPNDPMSPTWLTAGDCIRTHTPSPRPLHISSFCNRVNASRSPASPQEHRAHLGRHTQGDTRICALQSGRPSQITATWLRPDCTCMRRKLSGQEQPYRCATAHELRDGTPELAMFKRVWRRRGTVLLSSLEKLDLHLNGSAARDLVEAIVTITLIGCHNHRPLHEHTVWSKS